MKDKYYGLFNLCKIRGRRINDDVYAQKLITNKKGSVPWFVGKELIYGGIQKNVIRNKVSHKDPRTPDEIKEGGMTGGDRMFHHFYSPVYSRYLKTFLKAEPITLIEIGILKGSGLAIWSDLFPESRIIGLDIDLGHFQNNMSFLKEKGAFQANLPETFEYDQFIENSDFFNNILEEKKADIVVDDGIHTDEAILATFKSVLPSLAERFVYFIEDNETIGKKLSKLYPMLKVKCLGELTVIYKNLPAFLF